MNRALLQKKMQDTKAKNQIIKENQNSKPSAENAKDAEALAGFVRENKEDRAFKASGDGKPLKHGTKYTRNQSYDDKKVIRKKITKTRPDGSQTRIEFKFIVVCDEEALANASKQMGFLFF